MKLFNLKISSDRLFRLLFHVLFWGMLLGWPLLGSMGDDRFHGFMVKMIPVSLTHIPLFFINTELLIPRVLRRRGIASYIFSLAILILAFISLQYAMKEWLFPQRRNDLFITTVFVLLVTAVSTGYGFIMYLIDQEKARQEEQRERLQSELSFLRSQISPHFIFNILNSIVYLIRARSGQAEPVTIKLAELMRYMLYDSEDTQVPLERELGYLKNYVELQQLRFGEDVEINFSQEGEAYAQTIEPMLMIPFVENAFKHGVGMVREPVINIAVNFDEKGLLFTVRNKIGPEPAEDKDASSGIGLRNVRRRLELLYPDTHRLEVSEEGEWFAVALRMQFDKEYRYLKNTGHEAEVYRR